VTISTMPRVILLGLLAILTVAGCGDDQDGAPAASSLPDSPWTLVSGIDVERWDAAPPGVTFAKAQLSGSTGCNRFTAGYTVDADTLAIGDVAATQMACTGAAAAVERAFLDALGQVTSWRLDGDELVLEGGAEPLRFGVPSLVGPWTLTSLLNGDAVSSAIAGTELTATFTDDGKLTGSAGCNTYTATYRADAGAITIAEPAATRMLCDTAVMEQETAYFEALGLTTAYRVEGSRLSLLTATGTFTATFERSAR
jgi:heat shock protein HslJ